MKINNKRIVITGGTSGIGYEMVRYLCPDNEVIVVSKNINRLNELSRKFDGVTTYQADLSKTGDTETIADIIVKRYESIDILINNAAVQHSAIFIDEKFRYERISYEIALNFTSICSMTYLLLPALLHKEKAIIMNVNSGLGLTPKTSSAIYCATKGALNIFSQSLRYQLEKTNISVQQAFLDLVDTKMTKGRGKNKTAPDVAAKKIIYGIEHDIPDHDIGKVKLLRALLRLSPSIAQSIMKKH